MDERFEKTNKQLKPTICERYDLKGNDDSICLSRETKNYERNKDEFIVPCNPCLAMISLSKIRTKYVT